MEPIEKKQETELPEVFTPEQEARIRELIREEINEDHNHREAFSDSAF